MSKPKIILAVTGGIAAYKMPDLCSALKKNGYEVIVMQTPASENFVTPASLEAMSDVYVRHEWGKPKHIDVTENLTSKDAFVVCPATANTIGKLALGISDNLVTDTALALPNNSVKRIFCPAMNTRMWLNGTLGKNVRLLQGRLWSMIEPAEGLLACGTTGKGKLPSTRSLVESINHITGMCNHE